MVIILSCVLGSPFECSFVGDFWPRKRARQTCANFHVCAYLCIPEKERAAGFLAVLRLGWGQRLYESLRVAIPCHASWEFRQINAASVCFVRSRRNSHYPFNNLHGLYCILLRWWLSLANTFARDFWGRKRATSEGVQRPLITAQHRPWTLISRSILSVCARAPPGSWAPGARESLRASPPAGLRSLWDLFGREGPMAPDATSGMRTSRCRALALAWPLWLAGGRRLPVGLSRRAATLR